MSGRILVIDDVAANRELIKQKLASSYYDVLLACDGEEAVDLAVREQPDIIMLDMMISVVDSFEVCVELKSRRETAHIPVIMMTAVEDGGDRIRGLEAGADDFLVKPIHDLALFARVRNLLRMKIMVDELRLREETTRELGLADVYEREDVVLNLSHTTLIAAPDLEQGLCWHNAVHKRLGVRTRVATRESEVLNLIKTDVPDAFVIHQHLAAGDDGLRLISGLRRQRETRQCAIVFVVDDGQMSTAAKGLDLGASDYLMAPFDPNELAVRLRSQMRRKLFADRLRDNLRDGLRMATVDPLTGLYNRRYARHHMATMLDQAQSAEESMAVMILDLDRFKLINDQHGHDVGDQILKQVARRLQENVRGVDLTVRLGGEEFCLAMPDTDALQAATAAERLRAAVEAPAFELADGRRLSCTVSIGVAVSDPNTRLDGVDTMLKTADEALYASKDTGRNRVSFAQCAA